MSDFEDLNFSLFAFAFLPFLPSFFAVCALRAFWGSWDLCLGEEEEKYEEMIEDLAVYLAFRLA